MSKASLKKALAGMDADQLRHLIIEAYEARKETREYLEYWLEPDSKTLADKFRKDIRGVFFTGKEKPKAKAHPRLSEANKLIRDFRAMCYDSEIVADMLIFLAETEADWLSYKYYRRTWYPSLMRYRQEAEKYVETAGLEALYSERLRRLEKNINILYRHIYIG